MKVRHLFTDDDAVSPVIGVILMVAITVILAAVIATFVLGLGESISNTAPQASFTNNFDADATATDSFGTDPTVQGGNGILTITHSGGDTIRAKNLFVTGGDASARQSWEAAGSFTAESEISAGSSIDYAADDNATVRVVYDDGKGSSAELDVWEGPDA